jgi:hypothetical protein
VNSHACPDPVDGAGGGGFEPYEAFMRRALGMVPNARVLLRIRVSPSFTPDSTIALLRNDDGTYLLRAVRLKEHVWFKMLEEMSAQQGPVVRLDRQRQAAALARLATSKTVKERTLDAPTARLFLRLWRALIRRAQVVREVGIQTATLDGVVYRVWQGHHGISTHSPDPGSVLGEAVASAERLESIVSDDGVDVEAQLESAREEMQNALDRTRRKEPCLEPYLGSF